LLPEFEHPGATSVQHVRSFESLAGILCTLDGDQTVADERQLRRSCTQSAVEFYHLRIDFGEGRSRRKSGEAGLLFLELYAQFFELGSNLYVLQSGKRLAELRYLFRQ
jgi:hypothetical protein